MKYLPLLHNHKIDIINQVLNDINYIQRMQKYRRWTDQSTGINPFIQPKSNSIKLTTLVTAALIAFIKLNIIAIFAFPIILSLLLQQYTSKNKALSQIVASPLKLFVRIIGLWGVDDHNFRNWLSKGNGKGRLILSNSLHVFDAFYFMSLIPAVRFIVSSPEQEKFETIYGLGAILSILSRKQPFFNEQALQRGSNFKQLLSRQLESGHTCILFYEGIRTIGLGTIKISKKLSNQIYNLEKDYCIAHLKYTSAPQNSFSVVSHPFVVFLMALGTCSISLRVRFNAIVIKDQHSEADVQKDVDNFLLANGSKLLETIPQSYFEFLDFFYKSQKGGYTQIPQNAEM